MNSELSNPAITMTSKTLPASRLIAVCLALWLAGCANLGYYAKAVDGHMAIRNRVQPIHTIIASPATDPKLKRSLSVVVELREFATQNLQLPDNQSFTVYADVGRRYAIWSVSATPELSMEPEKWCFVAAGCVSYRGFFSESEANHFAEDLRKKGYDVSVGGVRTYSTLGWFKDPILNTFLGYSDTELAQLIFHELAHQVVYVKDDSTFNESFATAVELEGVYRWLDQHGSDEQRARFDSAQRRKTASTALMLDYRKRLETLYASDKSDEEKRAGKARIFAELREKIFSRETSTGNAKQLAQRLNNSHLASISTYTQMVPEFRALLAQQNGDMVQFFKAVRKLGSLPKSERASLLKELVGERRSASNFNPYP